MGTPSCLHCGDGGQVWSGFVWGLWHPPGVIRVRGCRVCLRVLVLPGGDSKAGLGG